MGDDFAFQHSVSLLDIYRKQLQQEMEETNRKKFRGQPIAATTKEVNTRLLFTICNALKRSSYKFNANSVFIEKGQYGFYG